MDELVKGEPFCRYKIYEKLLQMFQIIGLDESIHFCRITFNF
jgi:hypothetical protein